MSQSLDRQRIVGVDIGGANLKYASVSGIAKSRFFPMWKHPDTLARSLREDLESFRETQALAVTMTGELADCFLDREQGVRHIVQQTLIAATECEIDCVRFYGVDGHFREFSKFPPDQLLPNQIPTDLLAAANWHALGSFVAKHLAPNSLLVDIGSTTTDIIPLRNGNVVTMAKTDFDRLCEGSLVYVGCRRTPVCALANQLTLRGQACSVMNEFFATIDDARLVLKLQPEFPDDTDSADGKPRTVKFAGNRIARMVGLDHRGLTTGEFNALASQIHDSAKFLISRGIEMVAGDYSGQVVCSGHGGDLLDLPNANSCLVLADELGEEISRCAPAYAVARLLADQFEMECLASSPSN